MRELVRQFWELASPYWRSEERWKSGGILLAVIALHLGSVYIMVLINLWYALFYNALQNRNFSAFSHQLLRFGVLAGIYIFAAVYRIYLRQMLQIRWRNWLTQRYAGRGYITAPTTICSSLEAPQITPISASRRTSTPLRDKRLYWGSAGWIRRDACLLRNHPLGAVGNA